MKLIRVLFVWLCVFAGSDLRAVNDSRPNIILILADDLGWTDLATYGSDFHDTPNLDKLASQGMKFTQAYSACTVCSPTRAAILTGKYPARLHLTDWIAGHQRPFAPLNPPDWTKFLPTNEVTVAKQLKALGYVTASIGKWHLGGPDSAPQKVGFDVNIAGTYKGSPMSYFSPYNNPELPDGPKGEYLTDRLGVETCKFIERNKDNPFFIYLPHFAVHTPIQAKPDLIEKYRKKIKPGLRHNDPEYAALLESLDASVGRVMEKLDELKLSERTVVIFTSDNGGLMKRTTNVPLRAGKGSVYEGGVRVPLLVRWPAAVKPGTTNGTPVISMDLYSTVLEIAGLKDAPAQDGLSLVPLLTQKGNLKRTELYWHYPHYHPGGATPYGVIRDGDLRLVHFYETGAWELYNISEDIGEKSNLVERMPDKAAELHRKLDLWRRNVGAQMPLPNPQFDAEKDAEREKRS